ncbi:MAG: UvrB/UvrC motif-containing protein [Verrucomicrobiaceae bacterium]
MKCDLCENKATVFYTQVTNGKMKKTALCESCAQQQGITDPEGLLMADHLMGFPKKAPDSNEGGIFPVEPTGDCPTCGFTLDDYVKIGRVGCGDCYVAFSKEIAERLPSLHKGLSHTGRVPKGLAEMEQKRSLVENLNKQLAIAVKAEDYETAAKLRDELAAAADSAATNQEEQQ